MKPLSASGTNTEQVDIQALNREDAKMEACGWCGSWHTIKQQHCPAIGAECRKMQTKEQLCPSLPYKLTRPTLYSIQHDQPTEEVDSMFNGVIQQAQKHRV